MAKKSDLMKQNVLVNTFNPAECPYKEFRDNELTPDHWGMGPSALRTHSTMSKTSKSMADFTWQDDQAQPLPRSARQYLHSWVRAEELALNRWNAEVAIFEENNGGKMSVMDIQLSHAQVMLRSSFCRRVLSLCFILERVEGLMVEHQWENFTFNMGTEGWRPKYHIYSPGLKPGGGPQHRPTLSKNGCYLVRLFYLGAWRCVWISDQVPVDATDSPLLPFSPLLNNSPTKPGAKQAPTVTSNVVHLWPLLICKKIGQALLKLAAPDMNDEDSGFEDELVLDFDILHALTGGLNLTYKDRDYEELWQRLSSEVPAFSWDDDDDTIASTTKSRSTKKPATKETAVVRRSSMTSIIIEDTKNLQPYTLPGISPGHEMDLLVIMVRDLPLKKPLPEPEVPLWKTIRWVDWARLHGLYEAYDCPRTRFLKVNGLLKLSYAPHLLDLQSTESITFRFREENDKTNPGKKPGKDVNRSTTANSSMGQQTKEELRDWIQYDMMEKVMKNISILYYPSMYSFTTAASNPPIRITKAPPNRALDISAPKNGPLYLQIDGPDENVIRISLNVINPRVLLNCGVPLVDEIESAYLVLEVYEWFVDCEMPDAKAFISTKGYNAVEVTLPPGRHFCRVWVHSRTNWYAMLLSESSLLLGTRDLIQCAAVRECPWASIFLLNLGAAFSSWIKVNRSVMNVGSTDLDFYRSYQPDLEWNSEVVRYNKSLLHWMFRQALQSFLIKRLPAPEFRAVCAVLRKYLCDPDFGLPPKPASNKSLRGISLMDPCDCVMPEAEESEICEQLLEEQEEVEEKSPVSQSMMDQLLSPVKPPITSQVCELATEELPCGLLKKEREKVIRKHEAATLIQAHWRGTWARKCLSSHVLVTPEVLKVIMENAFGNLEALSALMNEFFRMYPGAKYAYSVASALSAVYGLQQYTGNCFVTTKCKWIPYFQGVFNCHTPVKVHLDVQSSIKHSTLAVYDNDTGEEMPQAFNTHITFHFAPNERGYTITGHGCLPQPPGISSECHWQLTILSSTASSFHICDNREPCKEMNLASANKMHIDEIFIPNRRNILGGIQLLVNKHEVVCFRAASTSPELKMVAILKTISKTGETKELATCSGVGELYWPYIRLEPSIMPDAFEKNKHSASHLNLTATVRGSMYSSARSLKAPKQKQSNPGIKSKSSTKLREDKVVQKDPKQYCIEVVAPNGWPLSISQWYRVDEIRNSQESKKLDVPIKKPTKEKGSAKDKDKSISASIYQPVPGDAYIELECSVSESCFAQRDDGREIEFYQALKSWDANEPGRNLRGAEIRKEFRAEFMETIAVQPSEKSQSVGEELLRDEIMGEDGKEQPPPLQQGPTPASESGILEMSVETLEEVKYLTMPEQLRDKFIPLYFVPLCTKEYDEDNRTILTLEMAETAEAQRQERIKLALERMRQLQDYNEVYVLGRQKKRCRLLENLFVDAQWKPELNSVLEERDDAVAREALRILSATKKKQDDKKKK